jgi:putative DNA primase/helicase
VRAVAEDAADRMQVAADYIAWPLVVSSASLIGRGAGLRPRQRDDWTERPCLWWAGIGPPSSLKTPAIEIGTDPLRRQQKHDEAVYQRDYADWQEECRAARAANPQASKAEFPEPPVLERRYTASVTVEKLGDLLATAAPRGITVIRDELAGWIYDQEKYAKGGGDRQFYLEAYSGGSHPVDRITRGTIYIPDLFVSIVGGIQPDLARQVFGSGAEDGFAARFTAVWPDTPGEYRHVDRWPNRAARDALDAINDRLATTDWHTVLLTDDYKPLPYCRLDPEAQSLFDDWHTAHMRAQRRGAFEGRFAARAGKYPGLVARLILVFHLIEWAAGRVKVDHRVTAETATHVLDLVDEYLKPMERRIYAAYAVPPEAEGGRRIDRWITAERRERFTGRDVLRHDWTGLQNAQAVSAALDWLVTRRWLREADREPHKMGRPSAAYLVNPRLWEDATHG